ncbi:MAG: T9SS type A sorting domain-containing protein [Ignavibacteria bacterium]|nr:T9SS type A sorting domain-containing protein [Ignavibacteria bacterium]
MESNPIFSGVYPCSIFKLEQIDDKIGYFFPSDENNKEDLILINNTNFVIYTNNNNNGFNANLFANINTVMNILAVEVADINNDGFNDIIVAGQNTESPYNYGAKVYINNSGGSINSQPVWSLFNNSYISITPNISVNDLNKDGYNDLIIVSYENMTSVFINNKTTNHFGSTPTQHVYGNGYWNVPFKSVSQIRTADIYNTGGIALISAIYTPYYPYNSARVLNAITYQMNPAPPVIKGESYFDNGFYRPKILLRNRGDRDFSSYNIFKSAPSNNYVWTFIGSTNNSEYIDYTENIVIKGGVPINGKKIFYKAVSVDNAWFSSVYSNQIYYWTEGGIPDNLIEFIPGSIPKEYYSTNYPNPFNPVTTIIYNIPEPCNVRITVYNTLGQVVKTLVDKYHNKAASYETIFDATNLSGGIYFYKIEAENYIKTSRIVLLK